MINLKITIGPKKQNILKELIPNKKFDGTKYF